MVDSNDRERVGEAREELGKMVNFNAILINKTFNLIKNIFYITW